MLITVAGDDAKLIKQLEGLLAEQDHRVCPVSAPAALLKSLKSQTPDLIVLAQTRSPAPWVAMLKSVRADPALRPVPVLCVDPKAEAADGISLLDAGADDFINRPFNPRIFLARVRCLLRRRIWAGEVKEEPVTQLGTGPLQLRLVSRMASLNGAAIALTRLEFDLLAFFMRHVDRVFKREELLEAVWNYPQNVETRTLDKHVETLRRKLGAHGACIQTVHAVGYRFAPPAKVF